MSLADMSLPASTVEKIRQAMNDGLVLNGPCGVGKTQVMCCAAWDMLSRGDPMPFYANAVTLGETARLSTMESKAWVGRVVGANPRAVFLDDVNGPYSAFVLGVLDRVIDEQYNRMAPVVVSTNLSSAELERLLGEKSSSRLRETATWLELGRASRRPRSPR